jgi:UDP-glucose:(heptosyl)LPS alpha-1,3-glucosyltransferase
MVISEAMAACVPVVVSDLCGASANVASASGKVLSLQDSADAWAAAVAAELVRNTAPPAFEHSWQEVAREYLATYYAI